MTTTGEVGKGAFWHDTKPDNGLGPCQGPWWMVSDNERETILGCGNAKGFSIQRSRGDRINGYGNGGNGCESHGANSSSKEQEAVVGVKALERTRLSEAADKVVVRVSHQSLFDSLVPLGESGVEDRT